MGNNCICTPPVEHDKTANTFISPEQLFEKSYNKVFNDIIKRARIAIAYADKHGNLEATFAIPNTQVTDKHYIDAINQLKNEGWEVNGYFYTDTAGKYVKPLRYEQEWNYYHYGRGIVVKLTPSKKIQESKSVPVPVPVQESTYSYYYKPYY